MKKNAEECSSIICMKINNAEEFFNSFDPSQVEEKTIREDVESYLFDRIENIPDSNTVCINLSLPKTFPYSKEQIHTAIKNHFSNKIILLINNIKKESRTRAKDFALGLMFLALCLAAAHFFHSNAYDYPFFKVLGESASIIGWVAIWDPAAYFLYQKRKDKKNLSKYYMLQQAQINVNY